jgi:light-regulated signal transduction histidine kinase (bacteriophytochrome)
MTFRGYGEANGKLKELNRDLVRQKEAVEAANRELEAFSYSVSHDLRAPLRSIDGFSQILIEDNDGQLDERGKKHLRRVRDSAKRMGQIIDDLLALAHVTRRELRRTNIDVTALTRRIAERLRANDPARQVDFAIPEGMSADGDARLLEVLFENLLGNAWKFTSKRSRASIEVGLRKEGGPPVHFVRDNGAGFDASQAEKLFGPFQRFHSSKEFEGTGIGLATVQRVVHRHGGRLWAESQVDKGASFYFTLGDDQSQA